MPKNNNLRVKVTQMGTAVRQKMRKHKKLWLVLPLTSLALMSGGLAYKVMPLSYTPTTASADSTMSKNDVGHLLAKVRVDDATANSQQHTFNDNRLVSRVVNAVKQINPDAASVTDWERQSGTNPNVGHRMSRAEWARYTADGRGRETFDTFIMHEATDGLQDYYDGMASLFGDIGPKPGVTQPTNADRGTSLKLFTGSGLNDLQITRNQGDKAASEASIESTMGHTNSNYNPRSNPSEIGDYGAYNDEGDPHQKVPFWDSGSIIYHPLRREIENGSYHGYQEAVMSRRGHGLMRASLPKDNSHGAIVADFPNSATISGIGKTDVEVKVSGIHYYGYWRGPRSIVFARNLYGGLYYNGVKDMDVDYIFYKHGSNTPINMGKLKQATLEMREIFGLQKYGSAKQEGNDVAINNEHFVEAINNHELSNSKVATHDHTGETVQGAGGNTSNEYELAKNSIIRTYKSELLNSRNVTGGMYGSIGGNNNQDSVIFKLNSADNIFHVGSALGYGSFQPMTNRSHPAKPKLHKSTTQGSKTKSDTQHGKGDKFTKNPLQLNAGKSFKYTVTSKIPSDASETNKFQFLLTDNVPKQAAVIGVTTKNPLVSKMLSAEDGTKPQDIKLDMGAAALKKQGITSQQIKAMAGKRFSLTINANLTAKAKKSATEFTNGVKLHQDDNGTPSNSYGQATDKVHPKTPVPKKHPKPTPIRKATSRHTLVRPGQYYTYSVRGQVPGQYNYYNHREERSYTTGTGDSSSGFDVTPITSEEYSPGFSFGGISYPGYWYTTTTGYTHHYWHYSNGYNDDRYHLIDHLPKDVSIESVKSSVPGLPVTYSGNEVSMKLVPGSGTKDVYNGDANPTLPGDTASNDSEDNIQHWSGRHYTIRIRVRADKLPKHQQAGQDTRSINGRMTDDGHRDGWFNWYNQAHANEEFYTKNGDSKYKEKSNIVRNRIRVIQYRRLHYDFDHDQNGHGKQHVIPNGYMPRHDDHSLNGGPNAVKVHDENDGGNNDQYHKFFSSDDLIPGAEAKKQAQLAYGYEGTHVKIPLIKAYNTYKDEDGRTKHARYRFGYDNPNQDSVEQGRTVHAILGGFDYTTHKKSGQIIPYSSRPDKSESRNFKETGSDTTGDDPVNGSSYYDDRSQRFDMDFYKPYIVPRQHTHNGDGPNNGPDNSGDVRFIVDTDKQKNGLPFRLDLADNDYVYGRQNFHPNFDGDTLHVRITSNGHTVYENNNIPLNKWVHHIASKHGTKYVELRDKLDVANVSGLHAGGRVPLHVDVGFNDPTDAQLDGFTTDSHGYIASEDTMKGSNFGHGSDASKTEPERTIKYGVGSSDNPRVQSEELMLTQKHNEPGTFVTGYGMRSDLGLHYYGLMGADDMDETTENSNNPYHTGDASDQWADGDSSEERYSRGQNDFRRQVKSGTLMDFGYPSMFDRDTNIDHTRGKTMPYAHADGNGDVHSADRVDRLEHADTKDNSAKFSDNDTPTGDHGQKLDTFDSDNEYRLDRMFDDHFAEHLRNVNYNTDYKFYPRILQRMSGYSALKNNDDPLAKPKGTDNENGYLGYVGDFANARLFTPYWLPLSTNGSTGANERSQDYNAVFEKARPSFDDHSKGDGDADTASEGDNTGRLGGNFFNIDESRLDEAVGHKDVADHVPTDGSRSNETLGKDQAKSDHAIQSPLSKWQRIKYFNKKCMHWIETKFF